MKSLDERIKALRLRFKAMTDELCDDGEARSLARAFAPELFTDPPTHELVEIDYELIEQAKIVNDYFADSHLSTLKGEGK
jgi:uncharacterized protein YukJ